jgi:hypothetical protein
LVWLSQSLVYRPIALFLGPIYDSDTSYLYVFAAGPLVGIAALVALLTLSIKGSMIPRRDLLGWATGILLGLLITLPVGYFRYVRPVEIGEATASERYLHKVVPIQGVVSWSNTAGNAHVYRLEDASGSMNVTTRDTAEPPRVGEKVWVLGYVGLGGSGMDKAMLEHWRYIEHSQ